MTGYMSESQPHAHQGITWSDIITPRRRLSINTYITGGHPLDSLNSTQGKYNNAYSH